MSVSKNGAPENSASTEAGRNEGTPIRVTLSMLSLVPGGMGGSETYARELARGLDARTDVTVDAVVPGNAGGSSGIAAEHAIDSVIARPSTVGRLRALLNATLAKRSIRAVSADAAVVHFPFTVRVPNAGAGQATVMTVHDVQHRELPHLFSLAERIFRVFSYEIPARKADIVVTISEFARGGIEKHLKVPAERIRVIPLGVDIREFTPHLGEREEFVLYPARGWPHKNHAALLAAMELLRVDRPGLRLVLTGGNLDALGSMPEWVERRGLVSRDELLGLYRSASALVFPSLYEGFGLPPLEAMASGCPVAASNAGSIPEVCGDAAVLFDPTDPADIARGVREAIAAGPELSQRGLVRAAQFTWESCVDGHVAAYRDAARLHSTR